MEMMVVSGNKLTNVSRMLTDLTISLAFGFLLLNIPFSGSWGCHGKAFQTTNRSGFEPEFKIVPQTTVAVGSEKPRGFLSGLLVRKGLRPGKMSSAKMSALVSNSLSNDKVCYRFQPNFKKVPEMFPSDVWRWWPHVVIFIHVYPGIKHAFRRGRFCQ
jgi:hypothetical protein